VYFYALFYLLHSYNDETPPIRLKHEHTHAKKVKAIPLFDGQISKVQTCLYVEFNDDNTIQRSTIPATHPSAIFDRLKVADHAEISGRA
jgi:hypothetical protein